MSQVKALKFIKNPFKMCKQLYSLVQSLTGQLREMMKDPDVDPQGTDTFYSYTDYVICGCLFTYLALETQSLCDRHVLREIT